MSELSALPASPYLHLMMQKIQNFSLTACPQRRDQKIRRSVSRHPVDHDRRIQMFQTLNQQIQILFSFVNMKLPGEIIIRQIRPTKYMQQLQLDTLYISSVQIVHRLEEVPVSYER